MKKIFSLVFIVFLSVTAHAKENSCLKSLFWTTLGGDDMFPFSQTFDPNRGFDRRFWVPQRNEIWSLQDHDDGLIYVEVMDSLGVIRTGVAFEVIKPHIYVGAFNTPFYKMRFEIEIEQNFLRLQSDNRCEQAKFKIFQL